MSLTIQQIISDAQKLVGRLKERDSVAEALLSDTTLIQKKIHGMKQFQEDIEELNEVANQKPHSQLIANIQKENMREIQQENKELKLALEDYQCTLEHIMMKYREHTEEKIYKSAIDFKSLLNKRYQYIIKQQADKIQEMAAVMRKAAMIDDDKDLRCEEVVSRLKVENKGLKEVLEFSKTLNLSTKEDKDVQTESP